MFTKLICLFLLFFNMLKEEIYIIIYKKENLKLV